MTKEEVFYNNFKVISYELSMNTLIRCDNSIANIFYVKWNTKMSGTIEQEITQDEYKVLMDALNTKAGAVATMNAYIADAGRFINPADLQSVLLHTKPSWCDNPYPCAECNKVSDCLDRYNNGECK